VHQISTVENPAVSGPSGVASNRGDDDIPELKSEASKEAWLEDYDEYMEPPDAGEMCDDQSDISDFEDTYIKKRKRKGKVGRDGKNSSQENFTIDTYVQL